MRFSHPLATGSSGANGSVAFSVVCWDEVVAFVDSALLAPVVRVNAGTVKLLLVDLSIRRPRVKRFRVILII